MSENFIKSTENFQHVLKHEKFSTIVPQNLTTTTTTNNFVSMFGVFYINKCMR